MSELERCKWCGKEFKKVGQHLPYCEVYKLQKEADEHIQDLEIKTGKTQDILVPESSTAKINPDRFWAWTIGLGVQTGVMIGHLNDIREFCGNLMKLLREQLFAMNSGMADQIELLKEIVKLNQLACEAYEDVKREVGIPAKKEISEAEMAEEYDEIQRQEAQAPIEVISYKDEITLPEGTRQLKGTVEIITEKAVQISFKHGPAEIWIPKSTIHSTMKNDKNIEQTFVIDSWVLKKNGVIGEDD